MNNLILPNSSISAPLVCGPPGKIVTSARISRKSRREAPDKSRPPPVREPVCAELHLVERRSRLSLANDSRHDRKHRQSHPTRPLWLLAIRTQFGAEGCAILTRSAKLRNAKSRRGPEQEQCRPLSLGCPQARPRSEDTVAGRSSLRP
jgi:hypothetical protein